MLTFVLGYVASDLIGSGSEFNFSGAAGMAASGQACDTSSMQGSEPTGITLGDPLNFRFGPGLDYSIVTALEFCTSAKLVGRTADESWLLIQLPGNMEGWVYSEYVMSNVDLTDLEAVDDKLGNIPLSPTTLVPDAVAAYINDHGLYRRGDRSMVHRLQLFRERRGQL